MIYYECDGHIYEDFESAKNKMYSIILQNCCEYIKEYIKYGEGNVRYSTIVNSISNANELLNLIKEDNYNELIKHIGFHAKHFAVKKFYTKKYTYKTDKLNKCLDDIKPLIKKEIFK